MIDLPFLYALALAAITNMAFGYQLYRNGKLEARIRFLQQLVRIAGQRQPRGKDGRFISMTHKDMEKRLRD